MLRCRTALLFAAALLLVSGAWAQEACVENPDGFDNWDLNGDGVDVLCKTCAPDNSTCDECWDFTGRTDNGSCVFCNVEGKYGRYCSKCDGEEPGFCLACNGDTEGELSFGLYATADGTCEKCPLKNCLICDNLNGTCTFCKLGQGIMEDGQCGKCTDQDNCLQCEGTPGQCTECMANKWPNAAGVCTECTANCDTCSGTTTCKQCSEGFHLDAATKTCVPCTQKSCQSCDAAPDVCDRCESQGYKQQDGKCLKCEVEWCSLCETSTSTCDICQGPGYRHGPDVANGRKECVPCSIKHCASCQQDSSECDWCEDGYEWNNKAKTCTK